MRHATHLNSEARRKLVRLLVNEADARGSFEQIMNGIRADTEHFAASLRLPDVGDFVLTYQEATGIWSDVQAARDRLLQQAGLIREA